MWAKQLFVRNISNQLCRSTWECAITAECRCEMKYKVLIYSFSTTVTTCSFILNDLVFAILNCSFNFPLLPTAHSGAVNKLLIFPIELFKSTPLFRFTLCYSSHCRWREGEYESCCVHPESIFNAIVLMRLTNYVGNELLYIGWVTLTESVCNTRTVYNTGKICQIKGLIR